jgi:hypothetical protein
MRDERCEFELLLVAERPLSICVKPYEGAAPSVWLPRSQVTIRPKGRGVVAVDMPAWLAVEKGLA